jgi:hypothetical protein
MNVFDAQSLAEFIARRGMDVTYLPSRLCSCVGKDGTPRAGCDCINGVRYDLDKTQELRVLKTGMDYKRMPTELVNAMLGGANITVPRYAYDKDCKWSEVDVWQKASLNDIFIVKNARQRATDICVRGVRDSIRTYSLAFDDRENPLVLSISKEADIYDAENYSVDRNGVITWASGEGPADGEYYAVEFIENPHYVVWIALEMVRGHDASYDMPAIELPKKFAAKLRTYVPTSTAPSMGSQYHTNPLFTA